MSPNPNDTLEKALALLGYNDDAPAHHRTNLLQAIHEHAVSTGNEGLAFASEARINLIKAVATSADDIKH